MQKWLQFVTQLRAISGRVRIGPPSVNYLPGRNCTIYVVRVGCTGAIKRSDPCQKCAAMIKQYGIKKIVYSNDEGGFECVYANEYEAVHSTSGSQKMLRLGI